MPYHTELSSLPVLESSLDFLRDDPLYVEEKPYYLTVPLPTTYESQRTNLAYNASPALIYDIRSIHELFSLENDGLEYIRLPADFAINRKTKQTVDDYMRTHVDFVKNKLGAELCVCYSSRYRSAGTQPTIPENWQETATEPAYSPHIDQTTEGGMRRIRFTLTESEISKYLDGPGHEKWRLRIINVWRPLYHPVYNTPLALCDPKTLERDEIVAADRVSPAYVGEIYYIKHSPRQRWLWLSGQSPDEVLLFTSFDSNLDFNKAFIAHSAFQNPYAKPDLPPRESFELRLIVITRKSEGNGE